MHPRGTASLAADAPHIVLTMGLSLLTLLAMGFAAFAFDTSFRVYSIATLVVTMALGVLMAPYATHLAAGEPTPGFGILERVTIYASMAWMMVLARVLLRHPPRRDLGDALGA